MEALHYARNRNFSQRLTSASGGVVKSGTNLLRLGLYLFQISRFGFRFPRKLSGVIALKDSLGSDFVERVRPVFAPDGLLAKARNFEYRPQQQEMAVAVARALEEERHLVVEAGTGVGKSLAYLVPATLFALEQHKKAIISTHTINLQEQLIYKDIPILKKILPVEFEAALMKGRQNYLCPRRLERAIAKRERTFQHDRADDWRGWPIGRGRRATAR